MRKTLGVLAAVVLCSAAVWARPAIEALAESSARACVGEVGQSCVSVVVPSASRAVLVGDAVVVWMPEPPVVVLASCTTSAVDCATEIANACATHGGVKAVTFKASEGGSCDGQCQDNSAVACAAVTTHR